MQILYEEVAATPDRHRIFAAVPDREADEFTHTINVALSTMEIDETADNAALIRAIRRNLRVQPTDEEPDPGRFTVNDSGILLNPDGSPADVVTDAARAELRSDYAAGITRLEEIRTGALTMDVAELRLAMRDQAIIQKLCLRLLRLVFRR